MKKKALLLMIFFMFISINVVAQVSCGTIESVVGGKWKLVYENDENGNVLSGNLNTLITAVRNGDDIKIVVSVTIDNKEDAIVFNVLPNSVGVTSANIVYVKHLTVPNTMDSDGVPLLLEDIQQVQLFRSDGVREVLQYNMAGTTILRHDNRSHKIKWYVNK